MKFLHWGSVRRLPGMLIAPAPEPREQAERIVGVQLQIVLPAKAGVIAVCLYYLFYSGWFYVSAFGSVGMEFLQGYFIVYVFCNLVAVFVMARWRRFPPQLIQWTVFTLGLLDGVFIAGLQWMTGGFNSPAFWIFPGLIIINAISIPLAAPQLVLNFCLSAFFVAAGLMDLQLPKEQAILENTPSIRPRTAETTNRTPNVQSPPLRPVPAVTNGTNRLDEAAASRRPRPPLWDDQLPTEDSAPPAANAMLHLSVLWLLTACCYGVQVLVDRQRRSIQEAREFAMREGQLRSAARLSAEFAHQIKNPLAIINNAAFSLQRALREGRNDVSTHIGIIQEEVERSDRIVTQIMGYAQLGEGRVEKLDLVQELNQAVDQVFPPALTPGTQVRRDYGDYFPPLLMYRRHLTEIFLNVLQNARDALNGSGWLSVRAFCRPDYSIEVTIADSGPGIGPDRLERIFEAYYTTKEKGTGLGLAIVKHNIELYNGSVRVESELGKGAAFILTFPAKTVPGPGPAGTPISNLS